MHSSLFAYPWALLFLAVVPGWWWFLAYRARQQRQLARDVAGLAGWHRLGRRTIWRRSLALGLVPLFLILAASGPQWGYDPRQRLAYGRDVVIVLDISRSMLARDRADADGTQLLSRLQRAKNYLSAWMEILQRQGGYRIGVVWFAGQARLVCPLTDDYQHVRSLIELADPDFWGPAGRLATTDGGAIGTSLRHALEVAASAQETEAAGFQDILVVSDGDDQDPATLDYVGKIQQGVRIHCLGIGRSDSPASIPGAKPGEILHWDGQIVHTRRNDELLARLAQSGAGQYVPEEVADQPVVHWWVHVLSREPKRAWTPVGPPRPQQQGGWFLLAAVLCLVLALV